MRRTLKALVIHKRMMLTLLLLSFFITTIPNPCFAAPDRTIVCYNPWQLTTPDTQVVFNLKVTNPSILLFESFTLYTTGLPENWEASFYMGDKEVKIIGVDPGKSADLTLKVFVPENATPGDYPFDVWVSGLYVQASSTLTITVEKVYRVINLSGPLLSQSVLPGETASYPMEVENGGNVDERVFLYASVPGGWRKSFTADSKTISDLVLKARERRWIVFSATSPDAAQPGEYSLKVLAITGDGLYNASLSLEAAIVPYYTGGAYYETTIRCREPWQGTPPDTTVNFNLEVLNLSPKRESYFLKIMDLPENWRARFYLGTTEVKAVEIEPSKAVNLVLKVDVPSDAAPGDYQFRVKAEGSETDALKALTISVEKIARRLGLSCPFKSQTALTGKSLSYPIEVQNNGDKEERIYLSVKVSTELMKWQTSFVADGQTMDNLALGSGRRVWISFNVKPPYLVSAGQYSLTIVAVTEDGNFNASLPLTAVIVAYYKLEISGFQPINPRANAGEEVRITITVKNTGESPVTRLKLNIAAPPALSNIVITPLEMLSLDPGLSVNFLVRVSPPPETTPGDYVLGVQVVSNEERTGAEQLIVSITTPIPWFWISIGITIIATALVVIGIQQLFSRLRIKVRKAKQT